MEGSTEVKTPGYFAIIPAPVRYHPDLTASAKLMYGEIFALSEKEGFCWATNAYFAELYSVSGQTVSGWIKELVNAGFVAVEVIESRGNERRLTVAITVGGLPKNKKGSSGFSGEGSSGFSDPTNIGEKNKVEHGQKTRREDGFAIASKADSKAVSKEPNASAQHQEFMEEWNNLPPSIPPMKIMTDKRRKSFTARAKLDWWRDNWKEALRMLADSPFAKGVNDRGWTANPDWFLKPDSVAMILEGKYADKTPKKTEDPDFWRKHL